MTSKVRFTKRWLDAVVAERETGEVYADSEARGLVVRVYPSGRKVFAVRWGARNRRRWYQIGTYGPGMELDKARGEAHDIMARVVKGEDPAATRENVRDTPTVREWVAEYMAAAETRKKPSSMRGDRMYLANVSRRTGKHPRKCACFTCRWGNRLITELTIDGLESDRDRQKEGGRRTRANRWLASVRACLQAAWRRGLIPENPAMRIKAFSEGDPRTRVLTEDELDRLLVALDRMEREDPTEAAAFRVILETGCRRGEALGMKWEHLDLSELDRAEWRLPHPKGGKPEIKGLTRRLAALLSDLPRRGEYVIPGRRPDKPRSDLKRPWNRLRTEAQIEGLTIHDLRRSFGLAATRRVGLAMASRLLGHKDVRLTARHYAPFDLDLLRAAAESVAGDRAKVIPLRPAAAGENKAGKP
jgi:integrase